MEHAGYILRKTQQMMFSIQAARKQYIGIYRDKYAMK